MNSMGQKIEKALELKGWTHREFAEKINISESAVSRYINGERLPAGAVLLNIANVLDLSTDFLLDSSESKPEAKECSWNQVHEFLMRNGKSLTQEQRKEIINLLM